MVGRVHLTRQVSLDELRGRYRRKKNSRVKERLLAILHLYEGKTVKEVSKIVKRSYRSIERWLGGWNEKGYDGLTPRFTGGPKPKLIDSEWDRIVEEMTRNGQQVSEPSQPGNTTGVGKGQLGDQGCP